MPEKCYRAAFYTYLDIDIWPDLWFVTVKLHAVWMLEPLLRLSLSTV